jgi:hypothetical protein
MWVAHLNPVDLSRLHGAPGLPSTAVRESESVVSIYGLIVSGVRFALRVVCRSAVEAAAGEAAVWRHLLQALYPYKPRECGFVNKKIKKI